MAEIADKVHLKQDFVEEQVHILLFWGGFAKKKPEYTKRHRTI
jgi:hypothetical protein